RLFARNRFLGKNKQERPSSEAMRRDACPRKTIRSEQKSGSSQSREKPLLCLQSETAPHMRSRFSFWEKTGILQTRGEI
ncbi:hypothetical protein ACWS7L_15790, partial [Exiguobacterium artemiae]